MNWTADTLILVVGGALSLLFGIIPPTKRWFELNITDDWRPGFMALALLGFDVLALLFFSGHVTAWPAWGLPVFDWTGVWYALPEAGLVWFSAFGSNQITYLGTAKRQKDQATKANLLSSRLPYYEQFK